MKFVQHVETFPCSKFICSGSFHPQKLDLRQKWIILISRIAIILLKGYFEREKISHNFTVSDF